MSCGPCKQDRRREWARVGAAALLIGALILGFVLSPRCGDAQTFAGRGCGPCNPWNEPTGEWTINGTSAANLRPMNIQGVGSGNVGLRFGYGAAGASGEWAFGDTQGGVAPGVMQVTNRQGWLFSMVNEANVDSSFSWRFTHSSQDVADPLLQFRAEASQTGNITEWQDSSGANVAMVDTGGIASFPSIRPVSTTAGLFIEDDLGNQQLQFEDGVTLDMDARSQTWIFEVQDTEYFRMTGSSITVPNGITQTNGTAGFTNNGVTHADGGLTIEGSKFISISPTDGAMTYPLTTTTVTSNSTTTPTNVTGLRWSNITAGQTIRIECDLLVTTAATTTGVQVGLNTTNGDTLRARCDAWDAAGPAFVRYAPAAASDVSCAVTGHPDANQEQVIRLTGGWTNAAGTETLDVRVRSEVGASQVNVLAGSRCVVQAEN